MENFPSLNDILSLPSLTDSIKAQKKPVLLYGMGNGAELTMKYLAEHGIAYDGVFASDGFVRGQTFLGQKVLSVSEAEEKYGDFTAILSFALEGEKRKLAYDFAKKHTLFCPSVCPFGGVYDKSFFFENKDAFEALYLSLADSASKKALKQLIAFGVTGRLEYTHSLEFYPPEEYINHSLSHIDIGAYDGTTALEYLGMNKDCENVFAFEPDPIAFSRLEKNTKNSPVTAINSAVTDKNATAGFSSKGSRASSLGEGITVKTVSLDGFFDVKSINAKKQIGSIRIDGEGAENKILSGASNLLYSSRPAVCIAVYHNARDIIDIAKRLDYLLCGCELYLEVKPYIPAFDVFLYAIPRKSPKK